MNEGTVLVLDNSRPRNRNRKVPYGIQKCISPASVDMYKSCYCNSCPVCYSSFDAAKAEFTW